MNLFMHLMQGMFDLLSSMNGVTSYAQLLLCEKYVCIASGRYFDGYGNLNNWWQKGSARSFDEHAQCFINQYAQYRTDNGHINGLLTLDENVRNQTKLSFNTESNFL